MKRPGIAILVCMTLSLFITAAVQTAAANDFKKPVEYAPIHVETLKPEIISIERLQKGLSAVYYLEFFERTLDAIPTSKVSRYKMVKGKTIPEVNHQFGEEEVFDSGTNRGVAMRMIGYLSIKEKGTYQFQALSNDGVRVMLAGKTVISDPVQHSDRLSNVGHAAIDQPGYYAVVIEYFQRKGSASLKLFWKTPQTDVFAPIPQNVYVHLP